MTLLGQLQQILVDTPQDYRIVIDGDDRNGQQYYMAISRQDTIAYADDPGSLAPLGFDPREA